jgi:hypothetical protein
VGLQGVVGAVRRAERSEAMASQCSPTPRVNAPRHALRR